MSDDELRGGGGLVADGWQLVNQSFCPICSSPQKRIHRKCKESEKVEL